LLSKNTNTDKKSNCSSYNAVEDSWKTDQNFCSQKGGLKMPLCQNAKFLGKENEPLARLKLGQRASRMENEEL